MESKLEIIFISYRQLQNDRSSISDVPAVYFVEPTSDNIEKICKVWSIYTSIEHAVADLCCVIYHSIITELPPKLYRIWIATSMSHITSILVRQFHGHYLSSLRPRQYQTIYLPWFHRYVRNIWSRWQAIFALAKIPFLCTGLRSISPIYMHRAKFILY